MKVKGGNYFLKGAGIGLVLGIIVIIIVFLNVLNNWGFFEFVHAFFNFFVMLVSFIPMLFLGFSSTEGEGVGMAIIAFIVLVPLELFLIGGLIGWIVGKIKSRKHKK